jgi:hypothetical protein
LAIVGFKEFGGDMKWALTQKKQQNKSKYKEISFAD